VIEWLSAIGTFLAVIIALFAARIERWWQGTPKLALKAEQVAVLPPDQEPKAVVYLCIENRGTGQAGRAEVFAKAVNREEPSGSCERLSDFVPMSLRWTHSEPDHPEVFVTISPEMQRYCILGALKRRKSRSRECVL
jgi:hypothetical protein